MGHPRSRTTALVARRGRRVAIVLGAFIAAAALGAFLSRGVLLENYHLRRLQRDPESVWELTEAGFEDGDPTARAIDRFLASDHGRAWLVDELWAVYTSLPVELATPHSLGWREALAFGADAEGSRAAWIVRAAPEKLALRRIPTIDARSRQCLRLASRVALDRVPVPSQPGWLLTARALTDENLGEPRPRLALVAGLTRYLLFEKASSTR